MNRLPSWIRQHIAALRGLLVFTLICGVLYPVVMWGVAQVAFHNQANGSLVSYNGHMVGSSLLCQEFVDANPTGRGDRVGLGPGPRYLSPERLHAGGPGRRRQARQPSRHPGAGG